VQIAEVGGEIDAVIARLREQIDNPPRKPARRSPFDAARSDIDRIRKNFQRKINTTWHPIHSRAGIESKLSEAVEAGLKAVQNLENDYGSP
jgi:hypothetical protein